MPHPSSPQPEAAATPRERARRLRPGLVLRGMAMGTADLIPGVSGGTMALILGIYQELVATLGTLSTRPFLDAVLRLRLRRAYRLANGDFLLLVVAGIGTAVLALSRLMHALLASYPIAVNAFFFGLILASAALVGRRVGRWRGSTIAAAVLGTVAAFLVVGLTPARTPDTPLLLLASGALAICALILPGISGAFVLVLLGKYESLLGAITRLDLSLLLPFAVGAAAGLLSFSRVLAWLLRRQHDATMAVLAGFMLGSLRKVWPFLAADGTPAAPWVAGRGAPVLLALLLLGAACVVLLERAGARRAQETRRA